VATSERNRGTGVGVDKNATRQYRWYHDHRSHQAREGKKVLA